MPAHPVTRKHKLRVVLFNDSGFRYGAGIAHKRLAVALGAAGHEVFSLGAYSEFGDDIKATEEQVVRVILDHQPDVVILGNIHGAALGPECVQRIAARLPTISFSMTAGC
ncbi:MAG: hypothetical protein WDO13_14560 [Verrucomicrobiota bacterium]